jgi:hypothetical protein
MLLVYGPGAGTRAELRVPIDGLRS